MAINQQICLFDFLPQFLVILLREGGCITQNVVHVFCHLCSQCIEGGHPKKKSFDTQKSRLCGGHVQEKICRSWRSHA